MDLNNKKFSILVPCFNSGKTIRRCLESIFKQSFLNFEIIIVDDCSKDDTLREINKTISDNENIIKNKNINIKIIENKTNMGAGRARNIGIEKVSNDNLVMIDSDDYIDENLLNKLNEENADLIMYGFREQYLDKEKIIFKKDFLYKDYGEKIDKINLIKILSHHIEDNSFGYLWNKCYKVDIIRKNNITMKSDILYEDLYFNLEYMKYINNFSFIKDVLYFYNNINKNIKQSITKTSYNDYYDMALKKIKNCKNFFIENNVYDDTSKITLNRLFDRYSISNIVRKIDNKYNNQQINDEILNIRNKAKELNLDSKFNKQSNLYMKTYCYIVFIVKKYFYNIFLKIAK